MNPVISSLIPECPEFFLQQCRLDPYLPLFYAEFLPQTLDCGNMTFDCISLLPFRLRLGVHHAQKFALKVGQLLV